MRTPNIPPPDVNKRSDDNLITQTRRYKVITPLFGGGVKPGEADPVTVVRATEVRGHLRFWWRAMNVGRFQSIADLKRDEGQIWGSTETPSRVLVDIPVRSVDQGTPEIAFRVVREDKVKLVASPNLAPYAAFPFLPDKVEQKRVGWESEPVLVNTAFVLGLRYPESLRADVESALWAWETFGGIGARTRRGFGALQWQDSPNSYLAQPAEVERQIRARLAQLPLQSDELDLVPSLNPQLNLKITKAFSDPIAAWKDLISALQQFRQDRYGKKFGRSKWPEANEIRRLHGLPPKLPDGIQESSLVRKFPRAAFGLPIVFHMAHDQEIADDPLLEGVPNQNTGAKYDRLASPLILRPLACAGGKYVGLATILHAPTEPPRGLRLKGAPGDPAVSAKLSQSEAQQIEPLDGNRDVLQAFLDWL